ncbi:hypothetical protein GALMADRAFT_229586 [Galerina marginata CBS 339.88]|uniref:Extracellular membrane protein CFEM domain-containing protein n=1 Tax=Galerina marginata (strain CBS 339.88) TaxID=685588 RepID=A0A067SNK8_GALM3|nr:hypothetical protein GALMADRAFT_229586 [Galerina marginata CBS 339.88]
MHFPTILLSSVALTTLHVSALQVLKRDIFETLLPRQTTAGPCDATCVPFQTSLNTCTTAACVCTNAVASTLQACVNCAVTASPTSAVISSAQTLVSAYENGCASFPIQTVTVPGGASATGAPKPTSTGPLATTISNDIPFPPVSSFSQVIIGPSTGSTTSPSTSSPSSSSPSGNSVPGLVSAARKDGVIKVAMTMVSVALGVVLGL